MKSTKGVKNFQLLFLTFDVLKCLPLVRIFRLLITGDEANNLPIEVPYQVSYCNTIKILGRENPLAYFSVSSAMKKKVKH
jgi:hypothetical protein